MLDNKIRLQYQSLELLNVLCMQLGNDILMIQTCVKIGLPSELSSLKQAERFIQELVSDYKICQKRYSDILVAVSAAVSNAIHYGHKEHSPRLFYVEFNLIEERYLKFVISDSGKGFDYNNVPDPTDPNIEEQRGGRGIYLMRKLSDNCTFKKNGSEVILEFELGCS